MSIVTAVTVASFTALDIAEEEVVAESDASFGRAFTSWLRARWVCRR